MVALSFRVGCRLFSSAPARVLSWRPTRLDSTDYSGLQASGEVIARTRPGRTQQCKRCRRYPHKGTATGQAGAPASAPQIRASRKRAASDGMRVKKVKSLTTRRRAMEVQRSPQMTAERRWRRLSAASLPPRASYNGASR